MQIFSKVPAKTAKRRRRAAAKGRETTRSQESKSKTMSFGREGSALMARLGLFGERVRRLGGGRKRTARTETNEEFRHCGSGRAVAGDSRRLVGGVRVRSDGVTRDSGWTAATA